jgi:hypothetical protein
VSALSSRSLLSFSLPPIYHPARNRALMADPRNCDLSAHHSHYYALGLKLLRLLPDDRLLQQLQHVMDSRYIEIIVKTQPVPARQRQQEAAGAGGGGGNGFLSTPGLSFSVKLESFEREVFAWKLMGLRGFERWKGEGGKMRLREPHAALGPTARAAAAARVGDKRRVYADENDNGNARSKRTA